MQDEEIFHYPQYTGCGEMTNAKYFYVICVSSILANCLKNHSSCLCTHLGDAVSSGCYRSEVAHQKHNQMLMTLRSVSVTVWPEAREDPVQHEQLACCSRSSLGCCAPEKHTSHWSAHSRSPIYFSPSEARVMIVFTSTFAYTKSPHLTGLKYKSLSQRYRTDALSIPKPKVEGDVKGHILEEAWVHSDQYLALLNSQFALP